MDAESTDVIELLEKKRKYHVEQLRRINVALAALKGETDVVSKAKASSTKAIPWTAEVMKVFNEADKPLSLKQVCQKLAERGIREALDNKHRPTIYSTLDRGVKKEELEKAGYGLYRKKTIKRELRTRGPLGEATEIGQNEPT